jgi:hypothetical protein
MKIITARELMDLPEGVIYSEAAEGCFGLYSKGATILHGVSPADFFEVGLIPESGHFGPELSFSTGRWALFEDDFTFALYEKEDLETLLEYVQKGLQCQTV